MGEGALFDGTFTGSRGVGSITDTSWESSSSSESSSNAENNDFFLTIIVSSGFDSDFNFLIYFLKMPVRDNSILKDHYCQYLERRKSILQVQFKCLPLDSAR